MSCRITFRIVLAGFLFAATAGAHDTTDPQDPQPAVMAPNWRDNFVPYFDAGDPKTRHDSDTTNDDSRDNTETRRRAHRQRDEVKTTGETGQVGEGCPGGYCIAVADQSGDLVRVDQNLSIFTKDNGIPPFGGAAVQGRDPNWVAVEAAGAGAKVDFGASRDVTQSTPLGVKSVSVGENATDPEVTTDTEPDDLASRPAPSQVSFANSADHSLYALAHSPDDHGNAEFNQHDTHGGAITADVYLPGSGRQLKDSNVGVTAIDHLGCHAAAGPARRPGGCLDEYHAVYADPERVVYQVGEMPDQTERVATNPDRWYQGSNANGDQPPPFLNPIISPATTPVFDEVVNPFVDPSVSSATGVGEANSPCCAPKPCTAYDVDNNCIDPNAGKWCNRNAAGNVEELADRGAVAGCVELASGDCIGGAITPDGDVMGCASVGGMNTEGTDEECTIAAVDACCANGACL